MPLRAMPIHERPRERLMQHGEDLLSTSELIAIVLGSGTKGKTVLELAGELLQAFGSTNKLLSASVPELKRIKGIGSAKAIQLKAAFALAVRAYREKPEINPIIESSRDAFTELYPLFEDKMQELVGALLLDVKGRVIHKEIIYKGTLRQVMVHPREIFHVAVRHSANSLIIAHNHPSGDPTPSVADIKQTNSLAKCAELMGIELEDHLIIGDARYVSLRDNHILKTSA